VSGNTVFTQIAAGGRHTCGIQNATGHAFCWGRNSNSQLGDGTTADRSMPTPVSGDAIFKKISLGSFHTCGLNTTGRAFCWGKWGEWLWSFACKWRSRQLQLSSCTFA
jgi:alpha-tubulin suppressor-like RCC1 family protein